MEARVSSIEQQLADIVRRLDLLDGRRTRIPAPTPAEKMLPLSPQISTKAEKLQPLAPPATAGPLRRAHLFLFKDTRDQELLAQMPNLAPARVADLDEFINTIGIVAIENYPTERSIVLVSFVTGRISDEVKFNYDQLKYHFPAHNVSVLLMDNNTKGKLRESVLQDFLIEENIEGVIYALYKSNLKRRTRTLEDPQQLETELNARARV